MEHFSSSSFPALIGVTIQALSFIFTNLPAVLASVPLPIRYLFLVAEKQLSQHSRQLRPVGLPVWTLLNCLIQGLEDPDLLEKTSGLTLDRGANETLSLLAECLQAVVGIQQKVRLEALPTNKVYISDMSERTDACWWYLNLLAHKFTILSKKDLSARIYGCLNVCLQINCYQITFCCCP